MENENPKPLNPQKKANETCVNDTKQEMSFNPAQYSCD